MNHSNFMLAQKLKKKDKDFILWEYYAYYKIE